ncbi:MAG TPA: LysR family transcriptional regulator [Candidatus Thiothrix moscowensis]|uniref:LysR family transcriptional regulator n=1 Tax=unclassified Thiothrix TaxID=2636184 RepID=UPI0025FED545|nr:MULTISPECIES: LysR family transcriptional regulator [unclassified Thiothrix]HRJ52869.1 LysR family transcriptional regulator [Candidatus Thiothrix moscowensis]HRJ93419.1 LysR family transcriptional regulator [Candidatus Thiothrix moscowensis]
MHYYKQTRYKLLRTFCVVAQKENITHAAEQLHISQPTVSLQIQALEREMGEKLLERRGPSVRLTPEGKILYQLVQPIAAGIDGLKETFAASLGKMEQGELNIAAGQSTALYVLPKYLKLFNETYPGIRINLHNVEGQSGMRMLLEDQVDLAVGPLLQIPESIIYKPFASFGSILVTAKGHPLAGLERDITLEDISPYGLILPPRNMSTWRMIDTVFRQNEVPYSVAMEAGGWEVVKKYVEHGLGISIVTEVCLTGDEKIDAIPLRHYFPPRSYGLIVRRGKFFTPQAKRFIEMFDETFFENEQAG